MASPRCSTGSELRWLYRQMISVRVLSKLLKEELGQEELLSMLMDGHDEKEAGKEVGNEFRVSHGYRQQVAKMVVNFLESRGEEVDEKLYEIVLSPRAGDDSMCYVTYSRFDEVGKTLDEPWFRCRVLKGGMNKVGLVPWPAGMVMGEFLCEHPEFVNGKSVLELGAGIGVSGLCLMNVAQPRKLVMTDFDDEVLENLQHNVEINRFENVSVSKLDWLEPVLPDDDSFEVILAADCVYSPDLVPALVQVVETVLSKNLSEDAMALFVQTKRNEATFELFIDELTRKNIMIVDDSLFLPQKQRVFSYDQSCYLFDKTFDRSSVRIFRGYRCRVGRIDVSQVETFVNRFMRSNMPCLIENVVLSPCKDNFVTEDGKIDIEYFVANYGTANVPVVGRRCPRCDSQGKRENKINTESPQCETMKLVDYFDCWRYHEAFPGYLKDWHWFDKLGTTDTVYKTPAPFQNDWLNRDRDYKFVYCGPKGSSTGLHHDVFCSNSWSVNLCGKKLWILFPPRVIRPGEQLPPELQELINKCGDDETEVIENVELMVRKLLGENKQFFVVIQHVNEALFVPSGWYHQVHNLEDTLSINHNWFNEHNITYVFNFLVREWEKTCESLRDCKNSEEYEQLCHKIMHLNSGMNLQEFAKLVGGEEGERSGLYDVIATRIEQEIKKKIL